MGWRQISMTYRLEVFEGDRPMWINFVTTVWRGDNGISPHILVDRALAELNARTSWQGATHIEFDHEEDALVFKLKYS